jgi:hypothetical protein
MAAHDAVLVGLGAAAVAFGLTGKTFYIRLPGLRGETRTRVPTFLGRWWFVAGGALLIYLGVAH